MKVVSIADTRKEEDEVRKAHVLEVLDELREQIVSGHVVEFIASSITEDNSMQLHVACYDMAATIGILEISKQIVLNDYLDA